MVFTVVSIHCGILCAEVLKITHISEEVCYKYLQHWLWSDLMSDHSRTPCDTFMLYNSDGFLLDYSKLSDILLQIYTNFPSPDP